MLQVALVHNDMTLPLDPYDVGNNSLGAKGIRANKVKYVSKTEPRHRQGRKLRPHKQENKKLASTIAVSLIIYPSFGVIPKITSGLGINHHYHHYNESYNKVYQQINYHNYSGSVPIKIPLSPSVPQGSHTVPILLKGKSLYVMSTCESHA